MKGVPFEDFFSVTPSKIGISYKKLTATFLSKLSVFFFFTGNRRFKTRIIVFIEDLLITVGCGMLFSRLFVIGS